MDDKTPRRIRECGLTKSILNATIDAYRDYLEICDYTMGVGDTPEYWYTTAITRKIAKSYSHKNIYPVLEDSMKSLKDYSGSKPLGPMPKSLRLNGRTDIALWKYGRTKKGKIDWLPKSFIEVKRGNRWNAEFEKDISRIKTALKKLGEAQDGSLDGGFFLVVCDRRGDVEVRLNKRSKVRAKLVEDYKNISKGVSIALGNDYMFKGYPKYSPYHSETRSMALAMVFKIR